MIAAPSIKNNIDSSVKILVNANNSITYTTNDESTTTTVEDEASKFKLNTKVLYKRTEATTTTMLSQEDKVLELDCKIVNRLGEIKVVKHHDIVLDLLAIPSDISIATKPSGGNKENNSFNTSDTNSFMTSSSKIA